MALGLTSTRTYPTWNAQHTTPDQSTAPNTPNYPAPTVGLENYLHVNQSNTDPSHTSSHPPPVAMAPSQTPLRQQQYVYHPASAPPNGGPPIRFIDSNPRPAKSPRHVAPPELPPGSYHGEPYTNSTRFAPPYSGPSEPMPTRGPDYFPNPVPIHPWTTGPDAGAVYGTSAQTAPSVAHYDFHNETQYPKDEPHQQQQQHYTWSQGQS